MFLCLFFSASSVGSSEPARGSLWDHRKAQIPFYTFYMMLFRSHPSFWLVGMKLSDHTALGRDFHPACRAWGAEAEIWNHDAGNVLKRWKCNMQKGDLADTLMFGIWNGKISVNGMFYYLSVCIAAGGTVPSLCLHQTLGSNQGTSIPLKSQYDFPLWGHEQFPSNHTILE